MPRASGPALLGLLSASLTAGICMECVLGPSPTPLVRSWAVVMLVADRGGRWQAALELVLPLVDEHATAGRIGDIIATTCFHFIMNLCQATCLCNWWKEDTIQYKL